MIKCSAKSSYESYTIKIESVGQIKPFTENSTPKGQKFMVFLNILWISEQMPGQSNLQFPFV